MTRVDFGELVTGLSETVGYRRAREVVEASVATVGPGQQSDYSVDDALRICDDIAATHEAPLSLAARALRNRLRVRRIDRSATDATSLFENAVDPAVEVAFTGEGAVVRRTNGRFADAFGVDAAAATGSTLSELPVPPDDPGELESLLTSLRGGETLDVEVTGGTDGDGDSERVYRLRGIGALQGEEVTSAYLVYTDITERRRRQRELERRNEHLEAFASIVSHDLQNPLSIAKGYLEIARDEADVPHGEDIDEALDRMEEIIQEMLVLARSSQTIEDPSPIDIEQVALEAWRHVPTGDARLELGDLGRVRSDYTRLLHVFENLYRNAVEHSSTGDRPEAGDAGGEASEPSVGDAPDDAGEPVEPRAGTAGTEGSGEAAAAAGAGAPVTVRVWLDGDRLHIADDGPGMSVEQREQALEAGYSTRSAGTGLGLFIVKEIAEAHDWGIELGESEGGGLQVTIHGLERV
ncbi:PAS domain-containing sensor histidine kinase [Haloglomus litoreum]|uniref:sensor histidine kinase n=1 Tax=Haloglomus litoreum TaxID=3034026 RepID=UPI0023E7A68C|nr:PAS domain-containing sensor histidine kinase [Haloglomus sp. DT116]